MPAPGYKNFTIRREAAERLETYASLNGLKLVQLIDRLAEEIEIDVPFMYLLKAVKNSRLFMLKEAVETEYLRDLLVRLYLNLNAVSLELRSIVHPDAYLASYSYIKTAIIPIIDIVDYQVSRLKKILDESYPKGWATPLPPLPTAYGWLQPYRQPSEQLESTIKERILEFFEFIEKQIDDSLIILEKLKPYLPQLWESMEETLNQALLILREKVVNRLS
ncbi:MAG: hypothetical protein QW702_07930 [Candidatus Bathyarchaeia archaeon]